MKLEKQEPVYITIREKKTKKSKTITVYDTSIKELAAEIMRVLNAPK